MIYFGGSVLTGQTAHTWKVTTYFRTTCTIRRTVVTTWKIREAQLHMWFHAYAR